MPIRTPFHKMFFFQVMWQLDTTLFSMLIQRGLSDQHGNVWRADKRHYYAIEVTLTGREV